MRAHEQNGGGGATQKSCQSFVQRFYDWYVPLALSDKPAPAVATALKARPRAFSRQLLHLLEEDLQAQAKNTKEIVGLDFDPLLNSQDPGDRYAVQKVTIRDNRCSTEVYKVSPGTKGVRPDVVPQLMFQAGRWTFVNFHYGKGKESTDENLLQILARLRKSRQHAK